jgi:maleate cis-trans isomerase
MTLPSVDVRGLTMVGETQDLENCIRLLVPAGLDSIVYGGTSASFLKGPGWDQELIARMEAFADGVPCTTITTATVAAFQELAIKKIGVATPYVDEINDRLLKYFTQAGFETLEIKGLQIADPFAIANVVPETVYRLAKEVDTAEGDGVFISCGDLRTGAIVKYLEEDLKKPVVAAIQTAFWHALKLAKVGASVKGFGKLLERL